MPRTIAEGIVDCTASSALISCGVGSLYTVAWCAGGGTGVVAAKSFATTAACATTTVVADACGSNNLGFRPRPGGQAME